MFEIGNLQNLIFYLLIQEVLFILCRDMHNVNGKSIFEYLIEVMKAEG